MVFTPELPEKFFYLDDPRAREFSRQICDKKQVLSFIKKMKANSKYQSSIEHILERHYLEFLILFSSLYPETLEFVSGQRIQKMVNEFYEASEFLTIASAVYKQLPGEPQRLFRARFNGLFDNPQGLAPLSHELITAHRLAMLGFRVDFVEISGEGQFDFRIQKGDIVVQIDCKSIANDNGVYFDLQTGGMAHNIIAEDMKANFSSYNGHILHLQVKDRDKLKYDVGKEIKSVVSQASETGSAENSVFRLERWPFPDRLVNEIRSIRDDVRVPRSQKQNIWTMAVASYVKSIQADQVEALYISADHTSKDFRLCTLLTSAKKPNWVSNVVDAIKSSLNGQLKDQAAPALCIRYNNLSETEKFNLFRAKSNPSTRMISPSDLIVWNVVRSKPYYREKLCAVMFVHQPTYSVSSILSSSGGPVYKQDPLAKNIYLPDNPMGFKLQKAIEGTSTRTGLV